MTVTWTSLCRICLASLDTDFLENRCGKCGSPSIIRHPELHELTIALIDCDAFYASVEKRDNPSLADKPVIIGGGQRGVVAAACYVARLYGIRSAMPMFKAKQACPDAIVINPNMSKYKAVGEQIRELMREVTPFVQPLSIDEAFLDLTNIAAESGSSAAMRLAALVLRIEQKVGIHASIGLSYNKFLAKIASDLDKPRGFAVIGHAEARDFLADKSVNMLWGVGRSLAGKLRRDGITKIGQLQRMEEQELATKYGVIGSRLYHFSRGRDPRKVEPNLKTKSISAETTFESDISDFDALMERIVPLCHTVAQRLRSKELAGHGVTIKLKQSDFRLITRSRRLTSPTQKMEIIYRAAKWLIKREASGCRFRLIGIGVDDLTNASDADPPDLFATKEAKPNN